MLSSKLMTIGLLMTIVLLAACGQTGPLYHPDDKNPPIHVEKTTT